jgi:predicted dehydrogenase
MPSSSGTRLPRVALIGVTGYGTIYVQLVREALARKAIQLVAAVVINANEIPDLVAELKGYGATIYTNSEDFFAREAGRVDLCGIPVGIQWHARLTIAALRAGMNVLVEKPLAGSVADAEAIRKAEAATGRFVAIGFQDLYPLEARWLKNQLLGGVIGRIEDIRMIGLWPRARSYFSRNHWAGRATADGASVLDSPLNNAFAHFVNLSLFFAGPSACESAQVTIESAELFRAHEIEMFDTAVVRGSSDSGTRFWFGVSHAIEETRQPEISIRGSAGRAEWWHEQRCVIVDGAGHRRVFPLPSTEECRQLMFAAVLARLADLSTFVCTTAIAEAHTRLVEALHQAGEVQRFPASSIEWKNDPSLRSEIPCVRDLAANLGRSFSEGTALSSNPPFAANLAAAR